MAAPKFVNDNPTEILTEILTDFTNFTGKSLQPAQPEYLFCAAMAYRISLLMSRINAAGRNMLLEFASAPILDYLAELMGIVRLTAQKAVCTIQFTLTAGHNDLIIPAGIRIRSSDGQVVFETLEDISVLAADNIASATVRCQTEGNIGNNYAIGTITEIMDPQAYLQSAINLNITSGGSDAETDDQLRKRTFEAPSQFSVAGSRDAYKFHTFSASPLIVDVAVLTHSEDETIPRGVVNIYPLLEGGNIADSTLIDVIEGILTSESIKPLTDTVNVISPSEVEYSLTINIVKFIKASNNEIINAITTALNEFKQQKLLTLGNDIVNSEIAKICLVSGVYDLTVTIVPIGKSLTGDNLVIAGNEFPYLTNFTINITSSNNG